MNNQVPYRNNRKKRNKIQLYDGWAFFRTVEESAIYFWYTMHCGMCLYNLIKLNVIIPYNSLTVINGIYFRHILAHVQ